MLTDWYSDLSIRLIIPPILISGEMEWNYYGRALVPTECWTDLDIRLNIQSNLHVHETRHETEASDSQILGQLPVARVNRSPIFNCVRICSYRFLRRVYT